MPLETEPIILSIWRRGHREYAVRFHHKSASPVVAPNEKGTSGDARWVLVNSYELEGPKALHEYVDHGTYVLNEDL